MKNMKYIIAIFVLIVITFAGFAIFKSVALQNEKLNLIDISGDRTSLNNFKIDGVLSDGFHDVNFTIDNGDLKKDYKLIGDSEVSSSIKFNNAFRQEDEFYANIDYVIAEDANVEYSTVFYNGAELNIATADKAELVIHVVSPVYMINTGETTQTKVIKTGLTTISKAGEEFCFYDASYDDNPNPEYILCRDDIMIINLFDKKQILEDQNSWFNVYRHEGIVASIGSSTGNSIYCTTIRAGDCKGKLSLFKIDIINIESGSTVSPKITFGETVKIADLGEGEIQNLQVVNGNILVTMLKDDKMVLKLYNSNGKFLDSLDTELFGLNNISLLIANDYYNNSKNSPEKITYSALIISDNDFNSHCFFHYALTVTDKISLDWMSDNIGVVNYVRPYNITENDGEILILHSTPQEVGVINQSQGYLNIKVLDKNNEILYEGLLECNSYQDHQRSDLPHDEYAPLYYFWQDMLHYTFRDFIILEVN